MGHAQQLHAGRPVCTGEGGGLPCARGVQRAGGRKPCARGCTVDMGPVGNWSRGPCAQGVQRAPRPLAFAWTPIDASGTWPWSSRFFLRFHASLEHGVGARLCTTTYMSRVMFGSNLKAHMVGVSSSIPSSGEPSRHV